MSKKEIIKLRKFNEPKIDKKIKQLTNHLLILKLVKSTLGIISDYKGGEFEDELSIVINKTRDKLSLYRLFKKFKFRIKYKHMTYYNNISDDEEKWRINNGFYIHREQEFYLVNIDTDYIEFTCPIFREVFDFMSEISEQYDATVDKYFKKFLAEIELLDNVGIYSNEIQFPLKYINTISPQINAIYEKYQKKINEDFIKQRISYLNKLLKE